MNFKLTVDCNNDAFEPFPNDELARILRRLADRLDSAASPDAGTLADANGNTVGSFAFLPRVAS